MPSDNVIAEPILATQEDEEEEGCWDCGEVDCCCEYCDECGELIDYCTCCTECNETEANCRCNDEDEDDGLDPDEEV
jgi:hypothetical protein